MIDTVQAVLLFVIVLLTILFVVLGIQVFYILRDLRQTIKRTNNILDNVDHITQNISEPLASISGFMNNASTLGTVGKVLSIFMRRRSE
jgi:predicted PurR-regulated permease PerM